MKKIYEPVKVEHIDVDTSLDPQENAHRIAEEIKRNQ